jgi:hypothetical protein
MTHHATAIPVEPYRRFGTARREFTLAPVVDSQDVTRYQAQHMPPPQYDLARKNEPRSALATLLRALAFVTTGAVIAFLRHLTTPRHY